jgi:hypothetical protein
MLRNHEIVQVKLSNVRYFTEMLVNFLNLETRPLQFLLTTLILCYRTSWLAFTTMINIYQGYQLCRSNFLTIIQPRADHSESCLFFLRTLTSDITLTRDAVTFMQQWYKLRSGLIRLECCSACSSVSIQTMELTRLNRCRHLLVTNVQTKSLRINIQWQQPFPR